MKRIGNFLNKSLRTILTCIVLIFVTTFTLVYGAFGFLLDVLTMGFESAKEWGEVYDKLFEFHRTANDSLKEMWKET